MMNDVFKKIQFIKSRLAEIKKERKIYIKPEDVPKYQKLGYIIRRGPRGGLYIVVGERTTSDKERKTAKQILERVTNNTVLSSLKSIKDLVNEIGRIASDEEVDVGNLFNLIERAEKEVRERYDSGEFDESTARDILGELANLRNVIEEKFANDVLKIGITKVAIKGTKAYERAVSKLGVLKNFGDIEAIHYMGSFDDKSLYLIEISKIGTFEVSYDRNGTPTELKWIRERSSCDLLKDEKCMEAFIKHLGRKGLRNMFNAFAKFYGVKEVGNEKIVEIRREFAKIKKLILWEPGRGIGGRRIDFIIYVVAKAKKMGIIYASLKDIIQLLRMNGFADMLVELFAMTGQNK